MSTHFESSHIEIPFDGKIHQILISDDSSHLLIHIQKEDQGSCFHLLQSESFTIQKSWHSTDETPNLSVRAFNKDRFIAISFSEIQNPDLTDVYVFDWKNTEPQFVYSNTKVLACNADAIEIKHPMIQNRSVQFDLISGLELKEQTIIKTKPSNYQLPTAYENTNEYFEWFEKLLIKLGYQPKMQCEHLSESNRHIISFYTQQEKTLTNHLIFLDEQGNKLKNYTLASELMGIGKDTFFVVENKAIFVTQYNTLNVHYI